MGAGHRPRRLSLQSLLALLGPQSVSAAAASNEQRAASRAASSKQDSSEQRAREPETTTSDHIIKSPIRNPASCVRLAGERETVLWNRPRGFVPSLRSVVVAPHDVGLQLEYASKPVPAAAPTQQRHASLPSSPPNRGGGGGSGTEQRMDSTRSRRRWSATTTPAREHPHYE